MAARQLQSFTKEGKTMETDSRTSAAYLRPLFVGLIALSVLLAACAPAAAPAPTPAPPKPEAAKPAAAQPPAKPAPQPAAKPADKLAQPAAKAEPKPAEKIDVQAVADFYRGKTVRIIVGAAPGGGFDTYARAVARHIGRHIPGNPSVIVENMPGAGSLIAANHVYNVAPKDGTVIGHILGGSFSSNCSARQASSLSPPSGSSWASRLAKLPPAGCTAGPELPACGK
jgi:hypothetical protein